MERRTFQKTIKEVEVQIKSIQFSEEEDDNENLYSQIADNECVARWKFDNKDEDEDEEYEVNEIPSVSSKLTRTCRIFIVK